MDVPCDERVPVREASQAELDEELQFHLEERIRELTASGMTREAAAAEVARRFGSPLRLREQSLDVKLLPWLDSIGRDVRLGARMLRKNAVVTAAAVVSLSLALGACVAAFSLVDALILRPLPVRQPGQLIYLDVSHLLPRTARRPRRSATRSSSRMRDAARGHADLFAMSTQVMRPVRFGGPTGEKEQVRTQYVSGDAFDRLGVAPAAGRLLSARDDRRPGAHPVVVVSHAFWMRRFGGDPAIVGRWFDARGSAVRDRRRDRLALHGRRARPSDGRLVAVRDVQPARVRELQLRLDPRIRPARTTTSGSSRRRA